MQNDSNLETTLAEISKFPRQLAEDMFNEQVNFEAIIHIPTLSFDYSVSDIFEDFIDSIIDSKNADDIVEQHPQLKNIIEFIQDDGNHPTESASMLVRNCTEFEFLALVQKAVPRHFKFTPEGKFLSCSTGGIYEMNWIFAKDMTDAAVQAIKISEKIHAEEEQKARKEQELEA